MHKLTSTSIYLTYKRLIDDKIPCPDSFASSEKKTILRIILIAFNFDVLRGRRNDKYGINSKGKLVFMRDI